MHSPGHPSRARIVDRFRGFLPVVVDVETGGFHPETDALLEIAASIPRMDEHGWLHPQASFSTHVIPFPGSRIDPKSLEVTGIDPDNPLRAAVDDRSALNLIFKPVREAMKQQGCQRAILVGHNAAFDLAFLNAAVKRVQHKRNPFHPFSCLDTVSLAGLAYGQTVLSRALLAAGLDWNASEAHSAVYDTERTCELFCRIVNRWKALQDLEIERVGADNQGIPG
ncbi:MAG TPA: ribonuclease T [Rhodanobacteraceae bacterium]|nr:ribonuclease T [Rhodanobacteraceae bacterium]